MSVNDFLCFVKWYFDYIGNKYFDNSPPKIHTVVKVRKKERLLIVIFAYLLMSASALLFLISPPPGYLLSIALLLTAIGFLSMGRFSLIYYCLLYSKYSARNASVNDKIIFDECVLMESNNDIRKLISKYYRVVDVRGNIYALKFDLADKTKKRSNRVKLSSKDIVTLKFNPNAIFLDKKKIYAGKLINLSDLEEILYEAQKIFTPKL